MSALWVYILAPFGKFFGVCIVVFDVFDQNWITLSLVMESKLIFLPTSTKCISLIRLFASRSPPS